MNELDMGWVRPMVDDAVQQIWKVIYIPETPIVPFTEAIVEWDQVKRLFTATNKTDFYVWLETHAPGFEPGRMPDKLTRGKMGTCAFFGDRVFKFTSQQSEAEIAALLGKHQIPQVAIIEVVGIKNLKGIYCIAQERVRTDKLPEELITASWIVGDYIDDIYRPERRSPFKGQGVQKATQDAIQKYHNQAGDFVVNAYVEMILDLISKIEKKTGRVYIDMGAGNIGMKDNLPALFDLGGNYATKQKRVPQIREI